jgi:hypothetical protein
MGIAVSTDNWQHVSGKIVVFVDDVGVVSDVDDIEVDDVDVSIVVVLIVVVP